MSIERLSRHLEYPREVLDYYIIQGNTESVMHMVGVLGCSIDMDNILTAITNDRYQILFYLLNAYMRKYAGILRTTDIRKIIKRITRMVGDEYKDAVVEIGENAIRRKVSRILSRYPENIVDSVYRYI